MRTFIMPILLLACLAAAPASRPVGKLPHIQVDVKNKQIRVDCQAVKADYPLEFLVVEKNTNEYEAIASTEAKPSNLHLALLMLGLKPGRPIHYDEATKTWLPPTGPAVQIWFEYDKDGHHEKVPAHRWMRDVKTKKEAPAFTWVFTGSETMPDGSYGADGSGFLVSVINNELSVLDVPELKSRALESREWERNPDLMPPTGTPVTMILSPEKQPAPATRPTP
jgi:hypothetical protein